MPKKKAKTPPQLQLQDEVSVKVRISDPAHPHYPETGIWTGKLIQFKFPPYNKMAYIALDHCRHGVEACYVSPGQITQL